MQEVIPTIYACKVGELWVSQEYGSIKLLDKPDRVLDETEARDLAQKTNGTIYIYTGKTYEQVMAEEAF